MKYGKRYGLPVLVALALIALAVYELYWLRGLYLSRREASETQIRLAVSRAEIEAFTVRARQGADSTVLSTSFQVEGVNGTARILSMKFAQAHDSIPSSISVFKPGDAVAGLMAHYEPDLLFLDRVLSRRLDSLGFTAAHQISLVRDNATLATAGTAGYAPAADDERFSVMSIVSYNSSYVLCCKPMARYILSGMTGILLTSVGMLLVLLLVFYLVMRALRKQRELDEMKSDFTGNMTHELKTPIAVAYAANDAMLVYGLDKNPEKREEYLKVTRESLEKLNRMVEQILSMTMEHQERLPLQRERTLLSPLLENAAKQARMSAGKPCAVTVSVEPAGLSADVDPALFASVVATLLDNAVKYSGTCATVRLSACRKGGGVRIAVADEGIGISPDRQKHIFEKYYRVPTGVMHDVKGYGIGLFFVKTVVERHGGSISVTSAPGKGSTFTIEL